LGVGRNIVRATAIKARKENRRGSPESSLCASHVVSHRWTVNRSRWCWPQIIKKTPEHQNEGVQPICWQGKRMKNVRFNNRWADGADREEAVRW
jgi:hypothetical protein